MNWKTIFSPVFQQRHTNLQRARISRCPVNSYKVQVRDTCPPKPPPPPPKPKDDTAFWGAMTVVFLAAGFAFIAKSAFLINLIKYMQ